MAKKEKKEKTNDKQEAGIFDALDSFMAMPFFDISSDESDTASDGDEKSAGSSMSFDFLPDDDGDEVTSNERAKSIRPFHNGKAKAKSKNSDATGDNEPGEGDGSE